MEKQLSEILWSRQLSENLWQIRERGHGDDFPVLIYLVLGREQAALIDTGFEGADILSEVRKITALPVIVLHTHGHLDHIGADHQFEEIYISPKELGRSGMGYTSRQQGQALYPGDRFDLGGVTLKTVETPGHTSGSVSFVSDELKIAFTGDGIANIHWFDEDGGSTVTAFQDMLKNFQSNIREDYLIYTAHLSDNYTSALVRDLIQATSDVRNGSEDKIENADFKILKHGELFAHRVGIATLYYRKENI